MNPTKALLEGDTTISVHAQGRVGRAWEGGGGLTSGRCLAMILLWDLPENLISSS